MRHQGKKGQEDCWALEVRDGMVCPTLEDEKMEWRWVRMWDGESLGLSLVPDEGCLSFLRTPSDTKKGLRSKFGVTGRWGGVAELSDRENHTTRATLSDR